MRSASDERRGVRVAQAATLVARTWLRLKLKSGCRIASND